MFRFVTEPVVNRLWKLILGLCLLASGMMVGCSSEADLPFMITGTAVAAVTKPIETRALPFPTPSQTMEPTALPELTGTPVPIEPEGCKKPPDDYTITHLNGYLFNQRTISMLEYAAERYSGEIDILGYAITQGSYTDAVSASFGTHSGAGAVDFSVMREGTYTVLYDEIEPLIRALREAGFAAWLRDLGEVYPGSPIHIHAIAIGDRHLSAAAVDQLIGAVGYFRGYTGLPEAPAEDRHGGPVICLWMLEAGYSDLRPTPTALLSGFPE